MGTLEVTCVFSLSLLAVSVALVSGKGFGDMGGGYGRTGNESLDFMSRKRNSSDTTTSGVKTLSDYTPNYQHNHSIEPAMNFRECCSHGKAFAKMKLPGNCSGEQAEIEFGKGSNNTNCKEIFSRCCSRTRSMIARKKAITGFSRKDSHGSGSVNDSSSPMEVTAKMCCKAGSKYKTSTKGGVTMCEREYNLWSSKKKWELPSFCPDKFVACCMKQMSQKRKRAEIRRNKMRNKKRGKKWRNIDLDETIQNVSLEIVEEILELPDETGQIVEIHENRTKYEISFMDNDTVSGDYAGVTQLVAGVTQLIAKPEDDKTDMRGKPHPPEVIDNSMATELVNKRGKEKKLKGRERKFPDGKMPDGMRRSSNGHYYYVDFINPERKEKIRRPSMRKPSN